MQGLGSQAGQPGPRVCTWMLKLHVPSAAQSMEQGLPATSSRMFCTAAAGHGHTISQHSQLGYEGEVCSASCEAVSRLQLGTAPAGARCTRRHA